MPAPVAVFSRRNRCGFRAAGLLAEPRQSVKFAEQGNHRLACAKAGDKGVGDPTRIAGQLKTFRFQRIG